MAQVTASLCICGQPDCTLWYSDGAHEPDGWRTLPRDVYAVSRCGEARQLPAGTEVTPLQKMDGEDPDPEGTVEVAVWTDQVPPYDQDPPTTYWYLDASALMPRDLLAEFVQGCALDCVEGR